MARYTGSVCRLCRREQAKLFLKGDRCYSAQSRRKPSDYGIQLREKQKARRAYGVLESQFRKYFEIAERQKGITGENLLQLLERRLDNVVYRLGLGQSRAQARQMVLHGHIRVNGKKVDIPSYLTDAGDVITVREKSQASDRLKELRETADKPMPKWLEFDANNLTGKIVALPQRDDIDLTIEEHLIVELY